MPITIVVARYNEDVEWTKQFRNVRIFNKGSPLPAEYAETPLHNVGREGHTFYQYIYANYDRLDDYTVFLQGYPVDHLATVFERLHGYIDATSDIGIGFEYLAHSPLDCNLANCPRHPGLGNHLRAVYSDLFGEYKESMEFYFGAGGQFIVSRERILKHPREFYAKIVKLLDHNINPIEGFVMERFHGLIFS